MELATVAPKDEPRRRDRKKRQRKRLQSNFRSMLEDIPGVVVLGSDPLFQTLLGALYPQPPTVVSYQVIASGVPLTVVGVPDRIWVKSKSMAMLHKVKQRMIGLKRACILFPQEAITPNIAPRNLTAAPSLPQRHDVSATYGCSPHDPVACISHVAGGKDCIQPLQ